ncbi:hypothetical protein BKA70DRAFT_1526237 [Coprinopsis sp. MPI-PUGE-AT-0042]|nr:hypothetical protein BKA70DRAFT_1526237 [Coprinopsis sp. MPI-PUGE-AT-0042]
MSTTEWLDEPTTPDLDLHGPESLGNPTSESSKLSSHAERKKDLQDKLEKMRREVLRLQHDIILAQREYGAVYKTPSGLSKLPNEIFCKIFRWTQILHRKNSLPLCPLAEVAICSRWRALALAYPTLWTLFYYEGQSDVDLAIERSHTYLLRSKSQLLDVWVDLSGFKYGPGESQDWVDIPQLRPGLYISQEDRKPCPSIPTFLSTPQLNVGPKAPLTYVKLDRLLLLRRRPPLDHIVHLKIETPDTRSLNPEAVVELSWDAFREVIEMPTLESLSLWGWHVIEEPDSEPDLIAAPNLKHIRIGNTALDPLEFLLQDLEAPKLETITLSRVFLRGEDTPSAMSEGKFPSPQSLYLVDAHVLPDGWVNLVSLTPNLEHLVIAPYVRIQPDNEVTAGFAWVIENPDKVWTKLTSVSYNTYVDEDTVTSWHGEPMVRMPFRDADRWGNMFGKEEQALPILQSGDGVFMPKSWPPDFEWGDNSDDALCSDCEGVLFLQYIFA